MYSYSFDLSDHDYFALNVFYTFNVPQNRKRNLRGKYGVALGYALIPVAVSLLTGTSLWGNWMSWVIFSIAILWCVAYRKIAEFGIRRNMKRLSKIGKMPYSQRVAMTFEEAFFLCAGDNDESKASYTSLDGVWEGPEAIYLFRNAASVYILPNRIFQAPQEREAFLRFIREKVGTETDKAPE